MADIKHDHSSVCVDCGVPLTLVEADRYGYRCETHFEQWHDRFMAWINGSQDPKLRQQLGRL